MDSAEVADAPAQQSSPIVTIAARAVYIDLSCAPKTSIHTITSFASLMLFLPADPIGIIAILERKRHKILSTSEHLFGLYRSEGRKGQSPQACTALQSHPTRTARVDSSWHVLEPRSQVFGRHRLRWIRGTRPPSATSAFQSPFPRRRSLWIATRSLCVLYFQLFLCAEAAHLTCQTEAWIRLLPNLDYIATIITIIVDVIDDSLACAR